MRLRALCVLVAVTGLSFGAMTAASQAATRPAAKPATTFQVSITEFMFTPNRIMGVHVGDTVTWTNNGTVMHTSTAKGNVWNSGNLSPGSMFSFTFTATGVFKYRCNIHHQMQGGIQVVP